MSHWLALLVCVFASVSANMAFKHVMSGAPTELQWQTLIAVLLQPWLWFGFLMAGVILGAYLYAIREVPISMAYPVVTSMATIGMAMAGSWLFGEVLEWQAVAGIACVIFGMLLIFSA
jgi:multidrug transporter EmrE-like cation transporter